MKYQFTHLPNTAQALKFKVRSQEGGKESFFNISHAIVDVWGNPLESKLRAVMIAYIKKNGWSKEPVTITPKNSLRNINRYIASLPAKKA